MARRGYSYCQMAPDHERSAGDLTADPWREVFDASSVPSTVTRRRDGKILFVNPAILCMLGWTEDEVVGRTMVEAGFWSASADRAAMLERLDSTGAVRNHELTITTRAGKAIVVLTSISPVLLDGEECLVGHVHDVTRARNLEDQLRESEERFRQLTETLEQGFLLRDTDPARVLYASPALGRMLGVPVGALYDDPQAITSVVHPDDRERVAARRDEMVAATDFEFRIVRPDGATRWIRSRAHPVRMEGGRMTRLASVSEDITEERALREALLASEERFRLLAENSTDVIARSGPDSRIRYISPASRKLYGYEPEEMVGRDGAEFLHPDDLAALRARIGSPDEQPDDVTHVYRVRHRDGAYVWVEAKTHALRGPDGSVTEFHTSVRDITERKEAEAVVGRAREEAVRANRAKDEFLSRMSHELRTPLHAIIGFGELLAQDALEPPVHEGVAQITKAGRHLLELINEVLDIASIDRGELRMSLEAVHVGTLMSEALNMIAPLATAGTIELPTPDGDELDRHVLADRHRLKQVLLNLLSNAVKYTLPGGEVRVGVGVCDAGHVRIDVADTGIGIAPENLSRVFAAFDRIGAESTDVEGTGLGLTLSKRLIEAMGGTIGIESEVGRGTRLWITLPAADAPQVREDAIAAPPATADGTRAQAGRTVLYIEDNPSNIKLAEAILSRRPAVSLLVATQGRLGLELAREHRPAVILLDLNLPDISGEEVLRRLRGDERTATIDIVVLSADATPGQVDRLLRAGADHYLTKPFEIEDFLAVIDGQTAAVPVAADADTEATGPLHMERVTKLRRLYAEEGALRAFVELFVSDIAARIEQLEAAVRARDAAAAWQSAHAMRGSCSLAGAHRVEAALARIEAITAGGEELPGAAAIAALRSAFAEAERALLGEPS